MSKKNYISIIDPAEKNYQNFYSSQLYNTFFSIYGKFSATETDNGYLIDKLELETVNYKGIIDLNLTHAILEPIKKNDKIDGLWDAVAVKVAVKAAATKTSDFPVTIPDGKIELSKKVGVIYFERYVEPIHGGDEPKKALCDSIFDEEFYYREGLFTDEEALRTEFMPRLWKDRSKEGTTGGVGGEICPYNILRVNDIRVNDK